MGARRQGAPTVFFHGNADQLGQGPAYLGHLLSDKYGLGFFAIEYPGYGVAGGSPSESNINLAAEALLQHLSSSSKDGGLGVDRESVVLFGQSIGCAVAVEMAVRGFGAGMVLVSPFESLAAMAVALYPFVAPVAKLTPWLLLDKFDNAGKGKHISIPTLVMHGTEDEIVPFQQGKHLANTIQSASFLPVLGSGHNDIILTSRKFCMKL